MCGFDPGEWKCVTIGEHNMNRRCPVSDSKVASKLVLRWFPVVDERGRTRMESLWVDAAEAARPRVTHAA